MLEILLILRNTAVFFIAQSVMCYGIMKQIIINLFNIGTVRSSVGILEGFLYLPLHFLKNWQSLVSASLKLIFYPYFSVCDFESILSKKIYLSILLFSSMKLSTFHRIVMFLPLSTLQNIGFFRL